MLRHRAGGLSQRGSGDVTRDGDQEIITHLASDERHYDAAQ